MTLFFFLDVISRGHPHSPLGFTVALFDCVSLAFSLLPWESVASVPVNKNPIIQLINNLIKAHWHVSRA